MVEVKNNHAISCHDIKMDADGQADKEKILREQKKNARFGSIAETFQFMAAALLPLGLGSLMAAAGGASGISFASIGAALTTVAAPAVFIGVAAICTAVAIGSRYMASEHYHNAILNSSEMNAQHVAKYMVKELKSQASCVQSEHPENIRADGKKW